MSPVFGRAPRLVRAAVVVAFLSWLGAATVSAQQDGLAPPPLEARPVEPPLPANNDVNDGTDNTDVGLLQIELGSQWTRVDAGGRSAAMPVAARYGAYEWLEVVFGTDLVAGQSESGVGAHGVGDMQVGGRVRLFGSAGGLPPMSVIPQLSLPTADAASGLGTGHVDPSLGLLTGRDLPHGSHVDIGYGAASVGDGDGLGRFTQHSASISGSLGLTPAWTPGISFVWVSRQDADTGEAFVLSADSVLTLSRRVAFDLSVQFGLNHEAPRLGLGGGVSFVLGELDLEEGVHARRHKLRIWPHRRRTARPRR